MEKIVAECNLVISDFAEQYLFQIKNINEYFLNLVLPKNLDSQSHTNILVQFKLNFDELCVALMANGVHEPDKMTVFRFYSALKYFETRKPKAQRHETH